MCWTAVVQPAFVEHTAPGRGPLMPVWITDFGGFDGAMRPQTLTRGLHTSASDIKCRRGGNGGVPGRLVVGAGGWGGLGVGAMRVEC